MKKVALLIALMTIIALTAFAADIAVSVSGSSDLSFGVNLNDPLATGFLNSNASNMTVTLAAGASEKGAEEAVYGWIKVDGWSAKIDTNSGNWSGSSNAAGNDALLIAAGSVSAKIILPGAWILISGTNHGVNFIDNVQDPDNVDAVNLTEVAGPGLVIGITGAVPVEIGIASADDYVTVGSNNSANLYSAHVKTTLAFAPVTVEIAAEMGLNYAVTTLGAGGKLTLAIAPITLWAGADFELIDTTSAYEIGAGLSVAIADGLSFGATMSMDETNGLDVKITASESSGDAGAVPVLGLGLTVGLYNLDATLIWTVDVTADATVGPAKIYAGFGMGSDTVIDLKVGVELSVITNITLYGEYASTNLDTDSGTIKVGAKISL